MFIYWILLILVLLGYFAYREQRANRFYVFMSVVLIFISTFRGKEVGGDLYYYLPLFNNIANSWEATFSIDKYGFIFKIYIKLCSLISCNTTWLLFTTSLVNICFPLYFFKKHSISPLISLFLYISMSYYTNSFNSIRSSMSLACGMMVVHYLLSGKKWLALLWALASVEIHKSMFPIFILFYLINIKPTFVKISIPVVASIVVANIMGLSTFAFILSSYYDYGSLVKMDLDEMSSHGYTLLTMDIVILYIGYFFMRNKMSKEDAFLLNLFMLATCLQAGAPLFSLITRIAYFFSIYMVVLLPNSLSYIQSKELRKQYILVMMLISLAFFKVTIMTPRNLGLRNSNSQCTIPYYFVWENPPKL